MQSWLSLSSPWTMNSFRARTISCSCLHSHAWQRTWTIVDTEDVEWTFHSFPSIFLYHSPQTHRWALLTSGSVRSQRWWTILPRSFHHSSTGPGWNPGVLALCPVVCPCGHVASRKSLWLKKNRDIQNWRKCVQVRDPERLSPWSNHLLKIVWLPIQRQHESSEDPRVLQKCECLWNSLISSISAGCFLNWFLKNASNGNPSISK